MSTAGLKIWMWHRNVVCKGLNTDSDVMSGASVTENGWDL